MTKKVGIIGMGNVGCAVAHAMMVAGTADEYVFLDHTEEKVVANQLDFEDAMANLTHHASIRVNDWSALADADVLISTLGNIKLSQTSGDRLAELQFTSQMVAQVAGQIKQSGFKGTLIVVSNPLDVIATLFQSLTGLPANQVIGTGTLLDTARLQRLLGQALQVDPRSIQGYVLGEHGNSQVVAWSTVKALGQPIQGLLEERDLDQTKLEQAVIAGGMQVAQGKGFTSYGISAATVRLATAILTDEHAQLVVSHRRPGQLVYSSYPAVVGRQGILAEAHLDLLPGEEQQLAQSVALIQERYEEIKAVITA